MNPTIEALDKKVTRLDKMLSARINRSTDVESILIRMSKGKLPLPTKQDCLVLALRLGTPMKDWPDAISNHDFGENDDSINL